MNIFQAMVARLSIDSGVGYVEELPMRRPNTHAELLNLPLEKRFEMARGIPHAVIPVTKEEMRALSHQPRDPREDWRD